MQRRGLIKEGKEGRKEVKDAGTGSGDELGTANRSFTCLFLDYF